MEFTSKCEHHENKNQLHQLAVHEIDSCYVMVPLYDDSYKLRKKYPNTLRYTCQKIYPLNDEGLSMAKFEYYIYKRLEENN